MSHKHWKKCNFYIDFHKTLIKKYTVSKIIADYTSKNFQSHHYKFFQHSLDGQPPANTIIIEADINPTKNIENLENNTIKFDSKRIDFEKSNPIVISNEKSNIRYKDKKNNSFESKNTLDTKNKKRYPNYNNKESNHAIVANSKAKRNKSSKKNLFLETDLIATTKKNKN